MHFKVDTSVASLPGDLHGLSSTVHGDPVVAIRFLFVIDEQSDDTVAEFDHGIGAMLSSFQMTSKSLTTCS